MCCFIDMKIHTYMTPIYEGFVMVYDLIFGVVIFVWGCFICDDCDGVACFYCLVV